MVLGWNYGDLNTTQERLKDNPCAPIICAKIGEKPEGLSIQDAEALINKLRAMIDSVF